MGGRLSHLWTTHRPLLAVLAIAGTYFLYLYATDPLRPGAVHPRGWFSWYDQRQYLIEARALRRGNYDPALYQYPLGYPFLGAIFLRLTPGDPFMVPNLTAFVTMMGLFYALCARHFRPEIALLGTLLLAFATPLARFTVTPWTNTAATTACTFTVYAALGRDRLGHAVPLAGGVLLGWAFASRGGGEVLFLVPTLLALAWQFRSEPALGRKLLLGAGACTAVVCLALAGTYHIFGTPVHPYFGQVRQRGFHLSAVASSLWGTLVYSGPAGGFDGPLLREAPWIVLAPVGVALVLRDGRRRAVHVALLIGALGNLLVAASFPAFNAESLKFGCLRYVAMWLPLGSFYALLAAVAAGRALGARGGMAREL